MPHHLVTREFFDLVKSRLATDGIYVMNIVDHREKPRFALSVLATMKQTFQTVELWQSNETGQRATFVLAAIHQPTPSAQLVSRTTPGVIFRRMSENRLRDLRIEANPVTLSDDYAPVDRLIGVE